MRESIFNGLTEKECKAVAVTEGVIFVCALQSSVEQMVKSHELFLTKILHIQKNDITSSVNIGRGRYAIVSIQSISTYCDFHRVVYQTQTSNANLYCIGSPSEWKQLCNNIPIGIEIKPIHPNVAIDCTGHKPNFYVLHRNKDIEEARQILSNILLALAQRKPPIILFAKTEQDYNYIRFYRNIYGTKGVICSSTPPTYSTIQNSTKTIIICNARNSESVRCLINYIDNFSILENSELEIAGQKTILFQHSFNNIQIILYSFHERNVQLEDMLMSVGVDYRTIVPRSNIGIPSISAIAQDVKEQVINMIHSLMYE